MDDQNVVVVELHDRGDARGSSFCVPAELFGGTFLVTDMHITTIEPGAVRGNHYHLERREVLVVMAADRWSLHWDLGDETPVQRRDFSGPGAVLVTVPIGMSHAIRNDGTLAMRMVGLADGPYDVDKPDAYPRTVVADIRG